MFLQLARNNRTTRVKSKSTIFPKFFSVFGSRFTKAIQQSLVSGCFTGTLGDSNFLNHFLHLLWGWGSDGTDQESDNKINNHTQKADAFRRNAKPVVFTLGEKLEIYDIAQSKTDS